ncbi:MAG: cytochrome c3 family protein [Nibricoccus sp.]
MSKIFPKSANRLPLQIIIFVIVLAGVVTAATTYYATPKYTRVGYAPVQPVPYSHALHVDKLGLDCRYCHSNVEKSGVANLPTAQTCMNCHGTVKADSPLLAPVRAAFQSGEPLQWVRVHQLPDYVYFNHSVHVSRGVSCVSCHGKINEMETVYHAKSLSMGFCLDCHRNPQANVRPPDQVTNLNWDPSQTKIDGKTHAEWAAEFVKNNKIKPPQSCTGCHR